MDAIYDFLACIKAQQIFIPKILSPDGYAQISEKEIFKSIIQWHDYIIQHNDIHKLSCYRDQL